MHPLLRRFLAFRPPLHSNTTLKRCTTLSFSASIPTSARWVGHPLSFVSPPLHNRPSPPFPSFHPPPLHNRPYPLPPAPPLDPAPPSYAPLFLPLHTPLFEPWAPAPFHAPRISVNFASLTRALETRTWEVEASRTERSSHARKRDRKRPQTRETGAKGIHTRKEGKKTDENEPETRSYGRARDEGFPPVRLSRV